tara:strand:+ start:218 stop:331 length:114 start_codon:yes stop_codon:yes gene_type:complete
LAELQGKGNVYLGLELGCVHILEEELLKAEGKEEGKE